MFKQHYSRSLSKQCSGVTCATLTDYCYMSLPFIMLLYNLMTQGALTSVHSVQLNSTQAEYGVQKSAVCLQLKSFLLLSLTVTLKWKVSSFSHKFLHLQSVWGLALIQQILWPPIIGRNHRSSLYYDTEWDRTLSFEADVSKEAIIEYEWVWQIVRDDWFRALSNCGSGVWSASIKTGPTKEQWWSSDRWYV